MTLITLIFISFIIFVLFKLRGAKSSFKILAVISIILLIVVGIPWGIIRSPDFLDSDRKTLEADPINRAVYPNAKLVAIKSNGTTQNLLENVIDGASVRKVFVSQDSQEAIYSFYKDVASQHGITVEKGYEEQFTLPCFTGTLNKIFLTLNTDCGGSFVQSPLSNKYFKLSWPYAVFPEYISYRIYFAQRQKPTSVLSDVRFRSDPGFENFDFSSYATSYYLDIVMHY